MSKITFTLMLFLSISSIYAQENIEAIIEKGIEFHDAGEYEKAIEAYKSALKIDPKSEVANYEMALTYFHKKDYKKSIKYSDKVIKQKSTNMRMAYVTKGSSLDLLGKTKESIKLFEEAIKETQPHYLLYYNLALNYYKINKFDKAEENLLGAIDLNLSHSSSHLMLANIYLARNKKIQSLLSLHYFLFLEPTGPRAADAYSLVQEQMNNSVKKDKDQPNTFNISFSGDHNSEFMAAELMISMLEATKTLEENKDKSEEEMFVENTKGVFQMLHDMKEDKTQNIWWKFYIPFFYEIADSEHFETYCKYISISGDGAAQEWLDENPDKVEAFAKWLEMK
ncbi:MAG: tetratricopeptide repeat protein [Chitinophagales bacterium]